MAIKITYPAKDGQTYKLEYTRRSVQALEAKGFKATEVGDKLATSIPLMFECAFLAHHPYVKKPLIEEIYDHTPDKVGLTEKLIGMYQDVMTAMLADPADSQGNAVWETI